MKAKSNSIFVFLVRDLILGYKIKKAKESRNNNQVHELERARYHSAPWYHISQRQCWDLPFFEMTPVYFLLVILMKIFNPRNFDLTWKDIGMIKWSRCRSRYFIPERFNLAYMQKRELGWWRRVNEVGGKWITTYDREKGSRVSQPNVRWSVSHNNSFDMYFFGLSIDIFFEDKKGVYSAIFMPHVKRCQCLGCSRGTPGTFTPDPNRKYKEKVRKWQWFKAVRVQSPNEEPLSFYFLTLPPFIEWLVDWSPFLTQKFLELIGQCYQLYEGAGQRTFEYFGEIQSLDPEKPGSMRILESIDIADEDWDRGIYSCKDYVKNVFYDYIGVVDHSKREDVVVQEVVEYEQSFRPIDSLKTLLQTKGFSEQALPQVHIIQFVKHPVGTYIGYVIA